MCVWYLICTYSSRKCCMAKWSSENFVFCVGVGWIALSDENCCWSCSSLSIIIFWPALPLVIPFLLLWCAVTCCGIVCCGDWAGDEWWTLVVCTDSCDTKLCDCCCVECLPLCSAWLGIISSWRWFFSCWWLATGDFDVGPCGIGAAYNEVEKLSHEI